MIIALDGPAGVGKSTIAKLISQRNNLFYLNSGSFYRAVTLSLLEANGNSNNKDEVIFFAKQVNLSIHEGRMFLGNRDIEDFLHSDVVDKWVAIHSAIIEVRYIVNDLIRAICSGIDFVCEGRDMTTVVFPNADFKFFLDASPRVRAGRRFGQGVSKLSLEEIENSILERDHIDKNKEIGSLKVSDDAIYIDTSELSIDKVCERIERVFLERKIK